jgi:preprotein translocase subunit SecA
LKEVAEACYNERETQMGDENLRALERWQVTRSIDDYWMEHLAEMDYLRDAIWQEGYAQKEPIGVYRQEGYALFQKMLGEIRREVTEAIFDAQNDMPADDLLYGGPQLMDLQEARLIQALPMDEDGMDDSVQLDKDADGDDDPMLVVAPAAPRQSSTRSASSGSFLRQRLSHQVPTPETAAMVQTAATARSYRVPNAALANVAVKRIGKVRR